MTDWLGMAKEWAKEIGTLQVPYHIIAEQTAWGFKEVEAGRNPDVVLKELLAKITEQHEQWKEAAKNAPASHRPN